MSIACFRSNLAEDMAGFLFPSVALAMAAVNLDVVRRGEPIDGRRTAIAALSGASLSLAAFDLFNGEKESMLDAAGNQTSLWGWLFKVVAVVGTVTLAIFNMWSLENRGSSPDLANHDLFYALPVALIVVLGLELLAKFRCA